MTGADHAFAFPPDIAALADRVRNWGRWGDDDRLGTLNLIDGAAVRRAAACVVDGRVIALALPLSPDGPQMGFIAGRENPTHTMVTVHGAMGDAPGAPAWNDDAITMGTQSCTHWDGLGHASYGGHLYNGYPASEVDDAGAARLGIEHVTQVVSRGILLDVARACGTDRLEPGHAITAAELDAAVDLAAADVMPGDIVLVRTGHMQLFHAGDRRGYAIAAPGLSLDTVAWFADRDVAAVATDNLIFEVFPAERTDVLLPVHFIHIVDMGLTQGQNWDLEALATDCAGDGRYTFLLSATPEPVVGGVGAPVAPVAVK